MSGLAKKLTPRSFLTIGPYEKDAEFKELLRSLTRQGLVVFGLLGAIILIFFVFAHVFISGEVASWNYRDFDPDVNILLLDKTLILVICLSIIPLAYTSISLAWMRAIVSILAWLACMAMVMDDIAERDVSFMTGYTTIVLVLAVAMVPYKGWQMAILACGVIISMILLIDFVPQYLGITLLADLQDAQVIFISVIALLLTGMSSQLYINRYRQHLARKKAEELGQKLRERARVMEKLKEKSEEQAKQILQNEKLKDRFFANLSHEFRTPLTVILGPLKDALQDHKSADKKAVKTELLRLMYKNGQHLLELINQLLDLSKIDAGQIHLDLKTVDLAEFIPEKVRAYVPLAESRQVNLEWSCDDNPLFVELDPTQGERVIGNLVSNAIKFTPKGGTVSVSVSKIPANRIQVTVKDTGIGIPREELPHIFDRFYQVAHADDMEQPGTGIGLSLAKEIVELHGGSIHVESETGKGSKFIITLNQTTDDSKEISEPVGDEAPGKRAEFVDVTDALEWEDEPEVQAAADAPSVLLVDDNPDILAYLSPYLSRRYKVCARERSSEALELIRENHIDLVISDVMMPKPDGFELCRIIKETPELNHIPVILLTAQASEESRIEGLELGADDYISKPFSATELMVRVENLIELRRMLKEKFSKQVRIKGKRVEVPSEDARFLQKVQSVIEGHLEDSNFSVDWLAGEVNLSSRQLQRRIRSITNLSAGGYIRMIRLERASQLLRQEWGNISEIAYKVGFQDAKYFSKLFKQTFGVTPTEFTETEQ